jgi:eukaryotic-like serine/threonine-protein kinase
MMLGVGTRLGSYEILTLLGAGGMGEVYRAHDSRLGRDVALKILPEAFRSDPERLARFEREARALAALNHPNIAAIYGIEEQPGATALVLEFVEGETLADIIHRSEASSRKSEGAVLQTSHFRLQTSGGLPVAEALSVARQIADALDAAHEKGIIHRDLKPANIKITPGEVVKVLDFGLAKAIDPVHAGLSAADLSNSPTMSTGGTRAGMILGTAAYMSPEQARGLAVDRRTDIWAFGCVLYELLTGRVAFPGDTVSDVIAGILTRDVDWGALPPETPPMLVRLLRRCIEKDQKRRLRDIGDVRLDLLEIESTPRGTVSSTSGSAPAVREVQFHRLTDFSGLKESPTISPDGKMVAFVAVVGGKRQIWIRLLAGGALLQVTRDDADHEQPRWAQDSSTLIYYTPSPRRDEPGTVWEVSALGGWPRRVVEALGGGDISHDGTRIALFQLVDGQRALMTVARDGSRAERVATMPPGDGYTWPRWSPDDRTIAFQRTSAVGFEVAIEMVSVVTGERRPIYRSEWIMGFCWLPDGSGVICSSSHGSTLLYPPVFNLRTVDRDGRHDRPLTFGDQSYVHPDVHPAGRLLIGRIRSQSDIWKVPVGGTPAQNARQAIRITRQTGQVQTPTASPDGREVAYLSDNGGHGNLWVAKTDGSSSIRQLTFETDAAVVIGIPKWSPAGSQIVFLMTRAGQSGLWTVHPDGSGLRQMVERGWGPAWSSDGRWLYYRSPVTGDIHKVPVDGGEPVVVNTAPVAAPLAADGSTLYSSIALRSEIFGLWALETEIARASPEDGPHETLARVSGDRIPGIPPVLLPVLSPDGRWLAGPLIDGATTNLWAIPTSGGDWKQITDFGDRSTVIARSVSWSPDSGHIYAAIADTETDILLLNGLL